MWAREIRCNLAERMHAEREAKTENTSAGSAPTPIANVQHCQKNKAVWIIVLCELHLRKYLDNHDKADHDGEHCADNGLPHGEHADLGVAHGREDLALEGVAVVTVGSEDCHERPARDQARENSLGEDHALVVVHGSALAADSLVLLRGGGRLVQGPAGEDEEGKAAGTDDGGHPVLRDPPGHDEEAGVLDVASAHDERAAERGQEEITGLAALCWCVVYGPGWRKNTRVRAHAYVYEEACTLQALASTHDMHAFRVHAADAHI